MYIVCETCERIPSGLRVHETHDNVTLRPMPVRPPVKQPETYDWTTPSVLSRHYRKPRR